MENLIKRANNIAHARKIVGEFNRQNNTKFSLAPSRVVMGGAVTQSKKVKDTLAADLSASDQAQLQGVINFMQTLFPAIKIKTMTLPEYEEFLSANSLVRNAEAVLFGDTVIIPKNHIKMETLLEEFLHPFIEILYNDKRELFNSLYEEAFKEFPLLHLQIQRSYAPAVFQELTDETRQKELVTQALSRYLRQSMGKNRNKHNKFEYFVNKFISFIKNLFGESTVPDFETSSNNKTKIIPIKSLTNISSLANLAEALNTEGISFDVSKGIKGKTTYHLSYPDFGEGNYEFEEQSDGKVLILRTQDYIHPIVYDEMNNESFLGSPVSLEVWNDYKQIAEQNIKNLKCNPLNATVAQSLSDKALHELTPQMSSQESREKRIDYLVKQGSPLTPKEASLIISGQWETLSEVRKLRGTPIDSTEEWFKEDRTLGEYDPKSEKISYTKLSSYPELHASETFTIDYTPKGKTRQTYTIKGSHIYNE